MTEFAAEPLFFIGQFPFTNTLLHTLVVDGLLLGGTYVITKKIRMIPSYAQNAAEMLISTFYNLTESVAESKARMIFPYFITFFLFIFLANITALLPGFGTIGFFKEGEQGKTLIPLLRGTTSDFNTTLALALVSVAATHVLSIKTLGIKEYLGRYFSLNPINLFIGVLEIISEITKVVSLSFRLFGNIFAGEVVMATVSGMFAFLLPLPFMALEVIVAFVQALVFSMLTMAFMAILTTSHKSEH
jgi:F-type H+-transporting ATPase subunit a